MRSRNGEGESEREDVRIEVLRCWDETLMREIVDIERDAFGRGGINEWFLPAFARHGRVYCLWVNEVLMGVAELIRDWSDPGCAYIFGIAIREGWRGRGFGTRLLRWIIEDLRQGGLSRILLTVAPGNAPALSVYLEKCGFRKIGLFENEYGKSEDRYLLQLDMTEH